ncbi:MAG: hypothetical protein AAFR81_02445 [Chloroflexota bacterium]
MIKRRHMTSLSEDELILFDALWDGDCAWWMLTQENYQDITDHSYTHTLSDAELTDTLASLVERGLVRAYLYVYAETDDRRYFGLTPNGGALWELERKPNWERYCYTFLDDSSWLLESASLATAQAYARWAHDAGWGAPSRDNLQVIEKRTYRFLPWKDFEVVYTLQGQSLDATYKLDWEQYEQRRIWWQNLNELRSLS